MFNEDYLKTTVFPSNPDWLKALRLARLQAFLERGLPSKREEAWKYLDLTHLKKTALPLLPELSSSQVMSCDIPPHPTLVFINGRFEPKYTDIKSLPDAVIILPLSLAISTHEHLVKPFLERDDPLRHPFATLNAAFLSDGLFLYVPPHTTLTTPITCLYINQCEGMWHTRNLLTLGENAHATIIEQFDGYPDIHYFHNTVTQISLHASSTIDYYKLQKESKKAYHIANTQVYQANQSRLSTFHATTGGKISRDDLHSQLAGESARCDLKGFYLPAQDQSIDYHITTEHAAQCTHSEQHYKGILKENGRAIFNGKVLVRQEAPQTVAHQVNQNILLSSNAEIDTKPELEIYNQEVKCTHGATVGPLDDDAIFYLQSRGIQKTEAAQLLMDAFFNELTQTLPLKGMSEILSKMYHATHTASI